VYSLWYMAEELLKPQSLTGLDRLSPDGLAVFRKFIRDEGEERLLVPFVEGLRGMIDRDIEGARTKITALARSESPVRREIACHAVPYLAAKDPDSGFPLWRDLARDEEPYDHTDRRVSEAATQALVDTLGVLELDPERVVEVMRVSLEG
jgi:hypothetical protein